MCVVADHRLRVYADGLIIIYRRSMTYANEWMEMRKMFIFKTKTSISNGNKSEKKRMCNGRVIQIFKTL